MRINCKLLMDGPGPSDAIVSIRTVNDHEEEVVVYKGLLHNGFLEVGPVLHRGEGRALIELPRESTSGQWRIWVPEAELRELQAAE